MLLMIQHAAFVSISRLIAMLLEHYWGSLPVLIVWESDTLSPPARTHSSTLNIFLQTIFRRAVHTEPMPMWDLVRLSDI